MTSPAGRQSSQPNKNKNEVDSSKKCQSSYLLEIRGKGLQFYITEFKIKPNYSD